MAWMKIVAVFAECLDAIIAGQYRCAIFAERDAAGVAKLNIFAMIAI